MVLSAETPTYGNQNGGGLALGDPFGIGRRISRYTKNHAVIFDYDGVLSAPGETPAVGLVREYHEEGHISDSAWEDFQDAAESGDGAGDREFEGELLAIATQALEGEDKGELRSTTADFVAEHRDDILTRGADELLGEHQRKGRDTYIVSNNYRILFEELAGNSNIPLRNVFANVLGAKEENGKTLDGTLAQNVYQGKDEIAETISNDRYIWAAVGDSVSDFPLLRAAEHGYGVSPSEEFREKRDTSWSVYEDIAGVAEDMREKDSSLWERLLG